MAHTQREGQYWDKITEDVEPFTEARQLVESLFPVEAFRGKDILDAGCGLGVYSATMAGFEAHTVTGFDISMGSLRQASGNVPTGRFAQASLSQLPYPSESFDMVWSWGALHYVADSALALHEIARVLKPGGVAVIHTYRHGAWASLEFGAGKLLSKTPHWMQELMLATGERTIPLAVRLVTRRAPTAHTSKSIRQKLNERVFVPSDLRAFSFEQLCVGFGEGFQAREAHPPVPDLLKRNMSITVIAQKKA